MSERPIRFGFTGGASSKRAKLLESARLVEQLGYSTFGLADHFVRPFAPLIAGMAVADATTTLRITQTVLAQDFREPAVLAKELATLDVLSEGRLQVGLGAGWLRQEYEDASMRFDSAAVRIERLEETAVILRGLFSAEPFSFHGEHYRINDLTGAPVPDQRPGPPIMIGGGGKKVLSVAARQADIVQLMPSNRNGNTSLDPSQFAAPAIEEKIGWIRDAAGEPLRPDRTQRPAHRVRRHRPARRTSQRPRGPHLLRDRADGWRPDRPRHRRPPSVTHRRGRPARRGVREAGRHSPSLRDQLLRRADRRQAGDPGSGDRAAELGVTAQAVMAIRPPSTGITVPEMNDARSEERKHASSATSSGWPGRRSGAAS